MPGPTGILSQLTSEQQETLISWMESLPIQQVLANIGKAPPEGFALQTHVTSLRRFYHRWQLGQRKQDFDAAILQLGSSGQAKFEDAAIAAVVQRLFQIAVTPDPSCRNIERVAKWILALQRQRLQEQQHELAVKKAAFAAVVIEAKEHYQKIIAAREMLYGELDAREEE